MKYYRITADYRKTEPHPTYDFCVEDGVKIKELKQWFKSVYSWLDIYGVDEITPEETSKWVRTLKRKKSTETRRTD